MSWPEIPADLDLGGVALSTERHRTDKTLLVHGYLRDRPVLVKILYTDEQFWRTKFAHEISIYRGFSSFPPPALVPQLLHTDGQRVLVLEELSGRPVAGERYPSGPLPDMALRTMLEAVTSFALWTPSSEVLPPPILDYHERIARYHERGWFNATDRAVLEQLAAVVGPPATVQHGDPLPSNLLLRQNGCALLDFEFTGLYVPGWDLALLHTLLVDIPTAQEHVLAHRPTSCSDSAWLLNRALVLARERRIHHELPHASPGRHARLESLDAAWQALQHELHTR